MTAGLAVALIAEHVTCGTPLDELVSRLGADDKAGLAGDLCEVEKAVTALRDVVSPTARTGSVPPRGSRGKADPPTGHRMRNRFAGQCRCGRRVTAGNGWAVKRGTGWAVECRICGGQETTG